MVLLLNSVYGLIA